MKTRQLTVAASIIALTMTGCASGDSDNAASDSNAKVEYPTSDQSTFVTDLLADPLPEDEATQRIEDAGYIWRLGMVDGEFLPTTKDLRPERLTLTVADGLVIDAARG